MKKIIKHLVFSLSYVLSVVAMDTYFEIDIPGPEIRQIVRLVLASCCIKGHCVCPARLEQCKYLIQHNNYLQKKLYETQDPINAWRQGHRKSF